MKKKTVKSLSMELAHAEKVNEEQRKEITRLTGLLAEVELNLRNKELWNKLLLPDEMIEKLKIERDAVCTKPGDMSLRYAARDEGKFKKRFRAACAFIAGGHCMSIQGAIDSADELLRKLKGGD
jgi:hypothetical protein